MLPEPRWILANDSDWTDGYYLKYVCRGYTPELYLCENGRMASVSRGRDRGKVGGLFTEGYSWYGPIPWHPSELGEDNANAEPDPS